ncbi:TPA: inositol monophosphatase family protein [Streptococcus suis]|nr:inositol monophosphatase family protein [Streptococcus suis]
MDAKYQFALTIVKEAGDFLLEHLDDQLEITAKTNPQDLVTHVDMAIQERLSQAILSHYSNDHILGEEGGDVSSIDTGHVWVIDPIDGTTNFIAQKADFAIMLAYFEEGKGIFAIIYDLMNDEILHGGANYPVKLNDQLLPAPQKKDFAYSLLGLNAKIYAENAYGLRDLAQQTLGTRSVGSAGIGFSQVLKGRLLAYASYIYPWDYAAAAILGQALGFSLLSLENDQPLYQGREYVLLVADANVEEVKRYLTS